MCLYLIWNTTLNMSEFLKMSQNRVLFQNSAVNLGILCMFKNTLSGNIREHMTLIITNMRFISLIWLHEVRQHQPTLNPMSYDKMPCKCPLRTVSHCDTAITTTISPIARFMGPTWSPPGADRTKVAPCGPDENCYLGCNIVEDIVPQIYQMKLMICLYQIYQHVLKIVSGTHLGIYFGLTLEPSTNHPLCTYL